MLANSNGPEDREPSSEARKAFNGVKNKPAACPSTKIAVEHLVSTLRWLKHEPGEELVYICRDGSVFKPIWREGKLRAFKMIQPSAGWDLPELPHRVTLQAAETTVIVTPEYLLPKLLRLLGTICRGTHDV